MLIDRERNSPSVIAYFTNAECVHLCLKADIYAIIHLKPHRPEYHGHIDVQQWWCTCKDPEE